MSTQSEQDTNTAHDRAAVHHYILTVQRPGGISTRSGLYVPGPGQGRDAALQAIADRHFPGMFPGVVVLFFDIQPNQL